MKREGADTWRELEGVFVFPLSPRPGWVRTFAGKCQTERSKKVQWGRTGSENRVKWETRSHASMNIDGVYLIRGTYREGGFASDGTNVDEMREYELRSYNLVVLDPLWGSA
ncbi:hypothetical protein CRG98_036765 [Punica granatum]|uniref:Uncharacterized protein n=1 Tax=Punica granatum TaxID=22663 RepID=A0A2I0IG47_PUNGR|nr:hypothetical protein CRG98_036765 [Punica granatum]